VFVDIRSRIQAEIFDYQTLTDALKDMSAPRDKTTRLLRQGIIIRVKKGLYVFGDKYRRYPHSKELLANLVYGPSYVSLDYALAYHGLIPERVEALTSVTPSRPRRFDTPVGLFNYRQIPPRAYEVGVIRVEADHEQAFLIASPEKALADKVVSIRGTPIVSAVEMRRFIEEDLRIDAAAVRALSAERVDDYAGRYRSRRLRLLSKVISRFRSAGEGTAR
jgi:predicted transcriptional regulator of viral defense system